MLAALIVAAAYLAPLVGGETFALRDQVTWALPTRAFLHDALVHGRVPEWWDAVGLGVPFAANPVNGVTYPPTWIVGLVPYAWGSDLLYVAHLAWLAMGASWLARRLGADRTGGAVAGVAAALSGFAASALMNGIPLFALAWMPWVLGAVDRIARSDGPRLRATLLVAALFAAQIMAGAPGAVDTAVVATLWTLARAERRLPALAWMIAGLAAALVLAAVSLAPALALAGASERHAGLSFADATVWSLHPLRLGELVWPRLFGATPPDESGGTHLGATWAFSVYLGAPVVVLAGVAVARERAARWIALIAGFMLVVALGRYTPLYAIYRAVVVPERLVRYPEKHVGAVVVLVAALAGVGCTWAFASARARRIALLLGALALAFAVGRAWGAALACAAVGGALVLQRPSLALAAIAAHLAIEGWIVQPLVPRAALLRMPALLEPVASAATPRPRIYRLPGLQPRSNARGLAEASVAERDTGLPDAAAPFGFAHVPGFDAALDPRWHAVWDAGAGDGARLAERFDVRYFILPAAAVAHTPFVARAELGGLVLAENPHRRPRAFVAARLDALDDGVTPCTIASPRPEAIDLSCVAPAAGYAVLLDSFAAGWSATVDGAPAPIVRADEVARAVAIPAGAHSVAMRYRTPALRVGALVSLLAWLALVAAAYFTRAARAPRASGARP